VDKGSEVHGTSKEVPGIKHSETEPPGPPEINEVEDESELEDESATNANVNAPVALVEKENQRKAKKEKGGKHRPAGDGKGWVDPKADQQSLRRPTLEGTDLSGKSGSQGTGALNTAARRGYAETTGTANEMKRVHGTRQPAKGGHTNPVGGHVAPPGAGYNVGQGDQGPAREQRSGASGRGGGGGGGTPGADPNFDAYSAMLDDIENDPKRRSS